MTNYERLASESWNSHAMTEHKPKKGIGAKSGLLAEHGTGVTFADSLYSFTAQTTEVMASTGDVENDNLIVEDIESGGETNTGDLNGRDPLQYCIDEYLKKSIGAEPMNPEDRIATHKITKEQMEWLAARNDLENIRMGGDAGAFGKLLSDLVYLNVLSSTDVSDLMSPVLPIDDSLGARLGSLPEDTDYQLPTDDGTIFGLIARHIEEQKRELDYLKDEYFYTHHTEADMEYLKKLNDYLNNKKECFEVVWQIFDEIKVSEKASMYEDKRVRDASEQLKTDFGALLA